jgi:hypothetical protein
MLRFMKDWGYCSIEDRYASSLKRKDAAGIVTCGAHGRMYQCKGNGMVRDVFPAPQLLKLMGSMGIGHGLKGVLIYSSLSYCWNFFYGRESAILCQFTIWTGIGPQWKSHEH